MISTRLVQHDQMQLRHLAIIRAVVDELIDIYSTSRRDDCSEASYWCDLENTLYAATDNYKYQNMVLEVERRRDAEIGFPPLEH